MLLNGGHTALLFYPLEHQSRHIDRVARRRVVHRTFLRMDFVIEIDRRVSRTAADEVFSDDDDRNPCRTYVFLCARENQAKVFYIIYFRQEVGGLIRSEDDVPGIRDVAVTAAVDRIVGGDIHIIGVRAEIFSLQFRYVGIDIRF